MYVCACLCVTSTFFLSFIHIHIDHHVCVQIRTLTTILHLINVDQAFSTCQDMSGKWLFRSPHQNKKKPVCLYATSLLSLDHTKLGKGPHAPLVYMLNFLIFLIFWKYVDATLLQSDTGHVNNFMNMSLPLPFSNTSHWLGGLWFVWNQPWPERGSLNSRCLKISLEAIVRADFLPLRLWLLPLDYLCLVYDWKWGEEFTIMAPN